MLPAKSDLFELIADVEARIGLLKFGDSYPLYELMYEAAGRLGPIGCFYVCLYNAESETLHFAYNRDGDALEEPITLPMGAGPTSWVVRNQRPFFLSEASMSTQRVGLPFGDKSRVSNSAMHLPMRTVGADGHSQLIGVMSAQSYESDAYGVQEIGMIQALADRAARILHHDSGHDDCRRRIAALVEELERHHDRALRMSDDLVEQLSKVAEQAHALHTMTPGDLHHLRATEVALHRSLHKIMTLASEASTRMDEAHPEIAPRLKRATPLAANLTERELEMAKLLASGNSNASIAKALFIAIDTVKFHLANLYRKLGVRNRVDAVQAVQALLQRDRT